MDVPQPYYTLKSALIYIFQYFIDQFANEYSPSLDIIDQQLSLLLPKIIYPVQFLSSLPCETSIFFCLTGVKSTFISPGSKNYLTGTLS
jgi:hypothetical protein